MLRAQSIGLTGQLLVAVAIVFGISSIAQAAPNSTKFKPSYKVERCDCFGYSEDIPTFLSDLEGGNDIDIFGEGKSLEAASKSAHNMCVEQYRGLATKSKKYHISSVTESGCTKLRSTPDGEWVAI